MGDLAFDQKNIQWQIWIDAGEKPWIRKLIITEKKVPASPQWTAYFTDWNLSPQLADKLFAFAPPLEGKFILMLRLYWPYEPPQVSILDGTWKPPAVTRVD
jgi:hypothetical protein